MPTTTLPVQFVAAPLPINFQGTPQQFQDALVARLSIQSQDQFTIIQTGSTPPTSNAGPWLANGMAWYVWDTTTGTYIPIPVQPNFPFRANCSADQDVVFGGAGTITTDVVLTESFDPNNVFGGSVFSAPINGIYAINAAVKFSIASGSPATTLLQCQLKKNGIVMTDDIGDITVASPPATAQVNSLVSLVAGDGLSLTTVITTTAAGTLRINKIGTFFCGHRVQST